MHEYGLAQSILDVVVTRAGARRVSALQVRAGALQRIDEPTMDLAFAAVARGTVAEGARVELEVVPVTLTCRSCGAVTESPDPYATCGRCDGTDVDAVGGDELTLVSLTLATDSAPV
ncbi:MAG TPA: hydrogenase maturation nickel metallochaperone HypA [Nocardioidaceae bacterium]|jgi:hydrogenase nickel incorporation protein HypA/HybF|nr:hydrogenase maturation nickel metallochaperone HypA [Nocardioidaceae bacterium]